MASSNIFKDGQIATKFSDSNIEFSLKIYKTISEKYSAYESVFFSPFSISSALGMVHLGSRRTTFEQMSAALAFQTLGNDVHEAYADYIKYILKGNENYSLIAANRVYPNKKAKLVRRYLDLCKKLYQADITPLNFSKSEEARNIINDWVSMQTSGKIKDLIPQDCLNGLTTLVLVNAIYFKGNWTHQFNKSATRKMPFYSVLGGEVQVDMMFQRGKFKYMENRNMMFSALELPYKGNNLSMLFILPDDNTKLSALEEKITPEMFKQISRNILPSDVEVHLPKFKLEAQFELSDVLSSMGMPDAFTDGADFTGICDSWPIHISKVIHKAFVEVDEEGAEAAAATAVLMSFSRSMKQPRKTVYEFRADHPFMFFICDNVSHTILFAGRFTQSN